MELTHTGVLDAARVEITRLEHRREQLDAELTEIAGLLDLAHQAEKLGLELAGSRNGGAPAEQPPRRAKRKAESPKRERKPAAKASPNGGAPTSERREAIIAHIREHPGCSPKDIGEVTGRPESLKYDLTALRDAGVVQAQGGPRARRYWLTEQADAAAADIPRASSTYRTRVLEAITADPGALTEVRLAQALDIHREHVAVACGSLLEEGVIALQPDGTYTPDQGGGAENVDLTDRIVQQLGRAGGRVTDTELAYQLRREARPEAVAAALTLVLADGRADRDEQGRVGVAREVRSAA